MTPNEVAASSNYLIRFDALSQYGTARCFPCSHCGQVDLDGLSSQDKREYLYARAMIGLEFAYPVLVCCAGAF
ncbi:MAG: hypothetical protein RIQ60_3856 [Pseudomonadota bacterium]|jgi:hypothetical protein